MDSFEYLSEAAKSVERAEDLAPAGSYEHGQYIAAALMSAWPKIRAYVELERKRRGYLADPEIKAALHRRPHHRSP